MIEKKESSIFCLINEIKRRIAIIQSEPQNMTRELMINSLDVDLDEYIELHKDEIRNAYLSGQDDMQEQCNCQTEIRITSLGYYKKTFRE